jgi:hypothetical protein
MSKAKALLSRMAPINESLKRKKIRMINESYEAVKNTEDDLWCVKDQDGECAASGLSEEDAIQKAKELNGESEVAEDLNDSSGQPLGGQTQPTQGEKLDANKDLNAANEARRKAK